MLAQCWLHIGTEKTGSTSIQTFLAQNRAALLARGWLYPIAAGVPAHHKILACSLDDGRDDDARRIAGVDDNDSLAGFRLQVNSSLEKEVVASGASTLVLSNERLATMLRRPTEIARLKALCDRLARKTNVIVYLRNQVDFLASRYTNVIWEGGTEDFDFRGRAPIADYASLLDRWSDVFGKENLVVRRFEPARFPESGVVGDFARAVGLDVKDLHIPPRTNPSLDAESLAFLRGMNSRLPRALTGRRPLRDATVRVLQRRRDGARFTIPRPLAASIEDAYRDSNERVAREYFGARDGSLFASPILVSDSPAPRSLRTGTALRIGGFLASGLLHDAFIWAAGRLRRRR